ncbi:MAG: IS200/IS605 family transposase [Bacteroidota bacterium]
MDKKYLHKVLTGQLRLRVRASIAQVAEELGVQIINGVLSSDHMHLFVSPHISVSEFLRRTKGRSWRKIQEEFRQLRSRYWGHNFWVRGYFSSTRGNVPEEVINGYMNNHAEADPLNAAANMSLDCFRLPAVIRSPPTRSWRAVELSYKCNDSKHCLKFKQWWSCGEVEN